LLVAGHVEARKTALRRLLSLVLLAIAVFTLGLDRPALAAETANGAKIFSGNCASCHMGGGNIIIANKTLKRPALEKYNMTSMEAIVYQVQNGKNAMPAFKGRLSNKEIEDVAAYILEKAEQGW
jgi:cytochrome c6